MQAYNGIFRKQNPLSLYVDSVSKQRIDASKQVFETELMKWLAFSGIINPFESKDDLLALNTAG